MDCTASALEGTMDRWAAALKEPLLSETVVEREIMAVDSEHAKNKPSDYWRIYQLSKTLLASTEHPYGQFGSGCLGSLLPTSNSQPSGNNDAATPDTSDITGGEGKNGEEAGGKAGKESTAEDDPVKAQRIKALQKAVQDFWQTHYVVSNTTLVVLSSHSLEEQEAMVQKYFHNLPTTTASSSPVPPIPPLSTLTHCRRVDYVPIRPVYTLELHWPLDEINTLYLDKPTRVLSHLLGDEGPGSLLHVLRHEQPWVQELSADNASRSCSGFSVFILSLELTPTGWQHIDEIIALCFAYIDIMKGGDSTGSLLPPHIYQELKLMGDMQFEFLGISSSASDTASTLSVQMQQGFEPHHTLSGMYKYFAAQLDEDTLLKKFLNCMTPDNMLIFVGAPEYGKAASLESNHQGSHEQDEWQTDQWYGTQYRVLDVDPTTVNDQWKKPTHELVKHLHLPEPNEFLPSNFELVTLPEEVTKQHFPKKESHPICLRNDSDVQLWYKPDVAFSMPKVNIFVSFPMAMNGDSASGVMMSLWSEWQNELANIFAYAASMAGLHREWVANSKRATIELHVSGYSHKAALFCRRLLETTVGSTSKELPLDDELWERLIHKLGDQYHSFFMAQTYQHAIYYLDQCLEAVPTPKTIHQRMAELKRLTTADLIALHEKTFLKSSGIQILVHGNLTPQEAMDISIFVPEVLGQKSLSASDASQESTLTSKHTLKQRIVQLPPSKNLVFRRSAWSEENTNHCTLQYFSFGVLDLKANSALSLLRHLIAEPSYNQLRTQEQLGYIVHSQLKTSGDHVKSLVLLVQGEAQDPVHMDERMHVFWDSVKKTIEDMPDEDFQKHRQALYDNFMESKKNLLQESAAHWNVITNQSYHFDRIPDIAAHLQDQTKDSVLALLSDGVLKGPCISIQMFGHGTPVPDALVPSNGKTLTEIKDPIEFGRSQNLFPLPPTALVNVVDLKIGN